MNRRANLAIGAISLIIGVFVVVFFLANWDSLELQNWFKVIALVAGAVAVLAGIGGVANKIDMIKWWSD